MPIINPSQFECDKMEPGDVVFVRERGILYKWYRKHFKKDSLKIKVRKDWSEPIKYVIYYQEDCTLMFSYEIQCIQSFENEVPCMISSSPGGKSLKTERLKNLQIGLYNIQITFKNDLTLTIPTNFFDNGIKNNQLRLKNIEDRRIMQEALKFQRYKAEHFKKVIKDKNIEQWIPSYCSICGNPVIFKFEEDKVVIDNKCNCNTLNLILSEMTYDELAVWYANQINPNVKKEYENFWFKG